MHTTKIVVLIIVFAVLVQRLVLAQSGYTLTQWVVGSSGIANGGTYTLTGIAGQSQVGVLQGGNYVLVSGYRLSDSLPTATKVYLPLVTR